MTANHEYYPLRMERLDDACEGLPFPQVQSIHNYLLGFLSAGVTEELWQTAVTHALERNGISADPWESERPDPG
jgi:hypothetical protein